MNRLGEILSKNTDPQSAKKNLEPQTEHFERELLEVSFIDIENILCYGIDKIQTSIIFAMRKKPIHQTATVQSTLRRDITMVYLMNNKEMND
jgi:hypothetical protein